VDTQILRKPRPLKAETDRWKTGLSPFLVSTHIARLVRRVPLRRRKGAAFETIARYPAGREVDVYASPDDPMETILKSHPSWNTMIVLISTGTALLPLPVILWLFRKQLEPERYGRA
jgi:hypothetical protein